MKRHRTRYPGEEEATRWKSRGYVLVWLPEHPGAVGNGYIPEHRLVAEEIVGRPLEKGEVVHHINGQRDDNRIENLMVFPNHSEHRLFEAGDRCRNGHPRDEKNVVIRYSKGQPYRGCRACEYAKNWKRYWRNGGRWHK